MTQKARLKNGRVILIDGQVRLGEQGDGRPCRCCATECEAELTITVAFCGMSATVTMAVPGFLYAPGPVATLPDDSYIVLGAQISCTPCGWFLEISVCAYCVATGQYASDGFTAGIPFADTEEASGGHCPQAGPVELVCFGEQFGIPCVSTVTATIA